ncbi:TPA: trypsin-like peptidase domain-containing protein [Yersinia enterocolitica]|nr:trypsin-like peptidase domain-containing protein [Yersinia enterocolitica]HDL6888871.1 trypsin-like peptidase domain-containing protein [Yersinia enterocolitica]
MSDKNDLSLINIESAENNSSDVLVPTMKSLYIEMYFEDQLLSCGTAFLVANDRTSHCALITNRHNVTGRNQDTGDCLSKLGAIPNYIVIHFHKNIETNGEWLKVKLPLYRDDESPFWIEHPKLGDKADIVALNLNWESDVAKYPYYLKTDLDRTGILIGPAETVSVIGFPFGLSSKGKFPLWATGFMAQELTLITPDNPVFLIDCRTRQGQSGSAVIAYRPNGYRHLVGDKISSTMTTKHCWEFLGIYSGRVNAESDLGRVWHVSAIEEVLNAADADYVKRNEDKQMEENV